MVVVFILFRCYIGGGVRFFIIVFFFFLSLSPPLGGSEKIKAKNNYGCFRVLFTGL